MSYRSFRPGLVSFFVLASVLTVGLVETGAGTLPERLEQSRQLHLAAAGHSVDDVVFRLGHLELKMFSGAVYPLEAGDGAVLGFFFLGNGLYKYTSEDPVDREILEKNLQRTGNIDLLQQGKLSDRVEHALAFFARTPNELPWDRTTAGDTPTDELARRKFAAAWEKVGKTYLEYDHFTVQARANDHGQYAYVEFDGKKEDVGYIHDRMRGYTERFFGFRKFAGYDLRFFERMSNQLLDGGPAMHPPSVKLVDAEFDVRTGDNRTVEISTEQTFRVDRDTSVIALLLDNNADPRAYDWASTEYGLKIRSVRDSEGRDLAYSHRYHELLVELAEPAGAGEEFTLSFEIGGDYIHRFQKEYKRKYFSLFSGAWYPDPIGWNASEFTMRVRFSTPKEYRPVSSGETVSLEKGKDGWVLEAKSDKKIKNVALFAGSYTTIKRKFGDLTVRVHAFTPRGPVKDIEPMEKLAHLAADMIDVYSKMLVPYPYDSVDILDLPGFGGGIAPSGMILIGAPTFYRRGTNALLAHELAHQWFGHMAAPASIRERWLSESFAEYVSGLAMANMAGRDRSIVDFKVMHDQWWQDALDCREVGPIAAAGMLSGDEAAYDRYRLLYSKGPLVLRMLHAQLGNDKFYGVLREYLQEADYGFMTTADFERVVERAVGQEMDWYFRQWIQEGGLPEIRVQHRVQKRGGKTLLAGTASLVDGHPFKKMGIPLVLEYKSGQPQVRWIVFDQPETTFEFELASRPDKVKVDPARNFLAVFK